MGQNQTSTYNVSKVEEKQGYLRLSLSCSYKLTDSNSLFLDWEQCLVFLEYIDNISNRNLHNYQITMCDVGAEVINNNHLDLLIYFFSPKSIDIPKFKQEILPILYVQNRYFIPINDITVQESINKTQNQQIYQVSYRDQLYCLRTIPLTKIQYDCKTYVLDTDFMICARSLLFNAQIKQTQPFITKFIGYTYSQIQTNSVVCNLGFLEEFSKMNLFNEIIQKKQLKQYYKVHELLNITENIYAALQYLHKLNLSHTNLTPNNIFIDQQQRYKLGNLASNIHVSYNSNIFYQNLSAQDTINQYYIPPEFHQITNKYKTILDQINWSFSEVYQIAKIILDAGLLQFTCNDQNSIFIALEQFELKYNKQLTELLKQALHENLQNRIPLNSFIEKFVEIVNKDQEKFELIDNLSQNYPSDLWQLNIDGLLQNQFKSIFIKIDKTHKYLNDNRIIVLLDYLKANQFNLQSLYLYFGQFRDLYSTNDQSETLFNSNLFMKIVYLIRNNPNLKQIHIEIILSQHLSNTVLCEFAKSLKEQVSLEKLHLNFWQNNIATDEFNFILKQSLLNLTNLKELTLYFCNNTTFTEQSFDNIICIFNQFNGQLTKIDINYSKNLNITQQQFLRLLSSINLNTQLYYYCLKLNTLNMNSEIIVPQIYQNIESITHLKHLYISLYNSIDLQDQQFIMLIQSIKKQVGLSSIQIDCSNASKLTDKSLVEFILAMQCISKLENIVISFNNNSNITENMVIALLDIISKQFKQLKYVGLYFKYNKNLTHRVIDQLNNLLELLPNLEYVSAYFNQITNLSKNQLTNFKRICQRLKGYDYNIGLISQDIKEDISRFHLYSYNRYTMI